MIGTCEFCKREGVEVREYPLDDEEPALGCVDEQSCMRQMNYNEWGSK